jgi:AraC-like DNA-binding protein
MPINPVPDLFLYAARLRRIVESAEPRTQATALALGRSYGLKIKTLAGMAGCSESTVSRRLQLVGTHRQDRIAA